MGGIAAVSAADHRSLADPFRWGGLNADPDGETRRPTTTRFPDHRRAFLSPFWHALREVATPDVVEQLTPSHIASLLGWDVLEAVRAVPMTDEEAIGPVRQTRVGSGERRLRRVE
jgi:hypothetical protein